MLQILYTLLIGGSAAVIVFAACAAVQFVYPSMRLFFPRQSGLIPYGAVLALVVEFFLLAVYVPLPVVAGAIALLMVLAYGQLSPLPAGAIPMATVLASAIALTGEMDALRSMGRSYEVLALIVLYVFVPLVAGFAVRGPQDARPLWFAGAVLAVMAVVGPLLTGSLTHGTPAAVVVVCAIAGVSFQQARKPGSLGEAAVLASALTAAHVALTLAHAGAMIAALAMLAVLLLGYGLLAGRRRA